MSMDVNHGEDPERFSLGYTGIVPWDLSYRPKRNLYLDKVGVFGTTRMAAIDKVDEKTLLRRMANGIDNEEGSGEPQTFGEGLGGPVATGGGKKSKIDTRRPLEPDNWALRLHQTGGKKNLSTWGLRLIADNSNKSSAMECRGTMVIDQGDSQIWAFLNDLFQCADMKTPVESKELAFNGAGFLGLLYPDFAASGATLTRAALALSVHRNKGHVTDGGSVGALSHIITFEQPKADVATEGGAGRPGGPGTTVVQREPDPRKATSQPSKKDEALLRADAGICFGPGKVGRWLDEPDGKPKKGAESDERRLVRLFLDESAPPDDKIDTAKDGNSNHDVLPKSVGKKVIHGVVRVPKHGSGDEHHYSYSYHSNPPDRPPGSSDYVGTGGPDYEDTGEPPPASAGTSPDGSGPPVGADTPTVDDRYPTTTCDHGCLPGESPAFSQWCNMFPQNTIADVANKCSKSKPKGYRNCRVVMSVRTSGAITAGQGIELNVRIAASSIEGAGAAAFYAQAKRFDNAINWSTQWREIEFEFKGFDSTVEQAITLVIHRRAAPSWCTSSARQLQIRRTSLIWDD